MRIKIKLNENFGTLAWLNPQSLKEIRLNRITE